MRESLGEKGREKEEEGRGSQRAEREREVERAEREGRGMEKRGQHG